MSKLVINTQYRENYSFDNDGYPVEGPEAHWKYKGGSAYVVEGLTSGMINKIGQNGIPELTKLLEYKNAASEEYIIDWEIADDDAVVCEEWETPIVLVFDREHQEWTATKVTNNDEMGYMRSEIKMKTEKWTMLKGQERDDYTSQFLMADGQILSYQELEQFFKEAA
jgi:hypothetical protein